MWSVLARLAYLGLDLGFGAPPLLVLGRGGRWKLRRHPVALGLALAGSLAYSAFAERGAQKADLWRASSARTCGPRPRGVPWEEWLSLVEMALGLAAVTLLFETRPGRLGPARKARRMPRIAHGAYNLIAAFADVPAAQKAIDQLRAEGINGEDISLLGRSGDAVVTDNTVTTQEHSIPAAVKGAVEGAVAGGALGGLAGFLIGLAALAIPGVGPVMTAGVWGAAIGGGAIFGAQGGGFIGALTAETLSKGRAEAYEQYLTSGRVLIGVHTDDPAELQHAFDVVAREQPLAVDRYGTGSGTAA